MAELLIRSRSYHKATACAPALQPPELAQNAHYPLLSHLAIQL
jgi:hypothetical protein